MDSRLAVTQRAENSVTRVELAGRLGSSLPAEMREQVLALVKPGCRLVLDLSGLQAVSGHGLRLLLLFCRQVHAVGGTLELEGVSDQLRDFAECSGFRDLFREPSANGPLLHVSVPRRRHIDAYPTHRIGDYAVRVGRPFPLGATPLEGGINFAIYSRHAAKISLVLFEPGGTAQLAEIPFPREFRIGDVYAMTVFGLDEDGVEYGFRIDGPRDPVKGHRFDKTKVLLDPQARIVVGHEFWGRSSGACRLEYRARLAPHDFDWEDDRPLELPLEDLVIYEMHVRGFTRSESSAVAHPGTFAGLREKIPYLKELGVNCIELLPIFEFDESDMDRSNPLSGEPLCNYWGYNTVAFFAPKAAYAATGDFGLQADELRAMIKELHRNGIEIILDVVFNHTAEGNENGRTISFRGIDNRTYYLLTPDGHYYNFSGCGNTLNCNHPVVREFVMDCLRRWVADFHIDGFRFDLASILGRDQCGNPLSNPPLLEALAGDAVLGRTKLIAEAWDAGGLYQVGSFPAYGRWSEWNGRYRDCARKFLKGDLGQVSEMATRLAGSPDLYAGRGATASINFVTCHDGFTLADLVSYNEKHNEANGEQNRDGANDNYSWNCGVEGPTDDPAIVSLRKRQMKNALAMLLVSQGVPMLLMGDECGRTQLGNNNAYCHDSPLTWFDWGLLQSNAELFRFCRLMIRFRREQPMLRSQRHGDRETTELLWHGTQPHRPDWSGTSRVLAWQRSQAVGDRRDSIYAAMNMYWENLEFEPPIPPEGTTWHIVVNTAMPSPNDIHERGSEPPLSEQQPMMVGGRSLIVLIAR
jgi:glycogen operon protein